MNRGFNRFFSALLAVLMAFTALCAVSAFAEESITNGWNSDRTQYYVDADAVTAKFMEIDGKTYYFDKNGFKVTGLKKIGSDFYFFSENGTMKNGWQDVNNSRYYFSKDNGKALKGLRKLGDDRYYFNSNGKMHIGWKNHKNRRYYFYGGKGRRGKAATGFVKIKGYYYLFSGSGKMKTGWKKYNGNTYFFYRKGKRIGRAATGVVKIDGVSYKFGKKGKCLGEYYPMDDKAYGYDSPTRYLIMVNKRSHRVGIYQGSKHNWTRVKYWLCTVGAPGTRTPSGNFLIGPSGGKPFHQRYFDSGAVRCWWATRITGGYNFHSVLYTQHATPSHVYNGRLGADLSHGCVRLKIENAKWIYDNIPANTRCVIYYE